MGIRTVEPLLTEQIVISGRKRGGIFINESRTETDAIKEFVEYARAQGSIHADHYYSNCTRLAYKIVGITDKGTAAGSQLDDLSLVEHLIAHTLRTGMAAGRGYKDIYLDCKHRLESMKYLQCTA